MLNGLTEEQVGQLAMLQMPFPTVGFVCADLMDLRAVSQGVRGAMGRTAGGEDDETNERMENTWNGAAKEGVADMAGKMTKENTSGRAKTEPSQPTACTSKGTPVDFPLDAPLDWWVHGDIVYACSILWSDALMDAFLDAATHLKAGSRIITLKDVPLEGGLGGHSRFARFAPFFDRLGDNYFEMSWGMSPVWILRRNAFSSCN